MERTEPVHFLGVVLFEQALALYRSDPYLYRAAHGETDSQPLAAESPLAEGKQADQTVSAPSAELAAGTDGAKSKADVPTH